MKSTFLRVLLAVAVTFTFSALAQTGSAATPSGTGAKPADPVPSAPTATTGTGTKVGAINIQEAIFGSNEGRRDLEALEKKYEPKRNELKSQNDELEGLKKQMTTQEGKLNDEALATLKKQIETKQKLFDRAVQDAQEDFGNQQQEIASRILQKMAPMIVKYSQDNGFGMIVDTSKPWPQSNVLWWDAAIDITKAVVDAYNVQSGVPPPAPAAPGRHPAEDDSEGSACEARSAQADSATIATMRHLWCRESSSRPRENAAFFILRGAAAAGGAVSIPANRFHAGGHYVCRVCMLETSWAQRTRRSWTTLTSFGLQAVVIAPR